jgi:uncharacterized SAM-binding protein YcdF (DUF218 family)
MPRILEGKMLLFKKLIAPFFFPVSLCLELMFLGAIILWGTKRQKAGKLLVTLGAGLLALISTSFGADALLRPLEYKYPRLVDLNSIRHQDTGQEAVKWVVVLAGHEWLSWERPLEGVRLYRELPGIKLILSGGSVLGSTPGATILCRLALFMGVRPQDILLESESQDTEEEIRFIKVLVGKDRFILVTSASHMPRSMGLFKKQGLNPIPAPCGHLTPSSVNFSLRSFYPYARNIVSSEKAFYEYLGIVWAWLRGTI